MAEKITNNMIKDIEQRTSFWLGQLGENCEASTFDDEFRQKFLKLLSDKLASAYSMFEMEIGLRGKQQKKKNSEENRVVDGVVGHVVSSDVANAIPKKTSLKKKPPKWTVEESSSKKVRLPKKKEAHSDAEKVKDFQEGELVRIWNFYSKKYDHGQIVAMDKDRVQVRVDGRLHIRQWQYIHKYTN